MTVHTCPRCELRFQLDAEVREHLAVDHRLDPDALRPHLVPTPKAGRRLVVVVGNHTLLSDALRERLSSVAAEAPTDIHVVVPVQRDDDLDIGFWRGRALAERIVGPDVELTVDVGVDDPVVLVERSVHGAPVERVLVSTLPVSVSRWLASDIENRLRQVLGPSVTVEVVTAEG